jgi:hypothetical protein
MSNSRSAVLGLFGLATALLWTVSCAPVSVAASPPTLLTDTAEIHVTLSATYSTTSWDERDPHRLKFDLPLLYLHHGREAADAAERTLEIRITDLAGRSTVQIEAQSIHADITTGKRHTETTPLFSLDRPCTAADPCTVEWTFDATMPSDLYTLRLKDQGGKTLWEDRERPAFVALDTWDVELGAYTARIYYATLFPFARGQNDLANRLPPAAVTDFIEGQFIPIIADTWHTQVEAWGFGPLHPDWDPDRVVEVIITDPPYALFDGTGTYSRSVNPDGGLYPQRRIWWHATNNAFQVYDSLESAYKAVFAHEFFHLMQWNVLLITGQPTQRWGMFIEAQAKFASSVQYPEIELGKELGTHDDREYAGAANRFLLHRLNTSYRDLEADPTNKYDAALYWRFLYERYGDMGVIRAALEEMARHHDPDLLAGLEPALDAALARVPGPFHTFEESLVAFARANYALRLDAESQGRCTTPDPTACGGLFYDPQDVYTTPPLEAQLDYDGIGLTERSFTPTSSGMEFAALSDPNTTSSEPDADGASAYSGAIPASYGMDFIEVHLDPALHGQPLTIRFQGDGEVTRFNVQVWKLASGPSKPSAVTEQPAVMARTADGAQVYIIPSLDTETYDRLALIITRVDAEETADPVGGYRVTLENTAEVLRVSENP